LAMHAPRFSLSHGMFFVTVLYRLSLKATEIDVWMWDELELALPGLLPTNSSLGDVQYLVDTSVPLIVMTGHLTIFIAVTSIAKIALNLVATTNACPHLLFPFQFFDFVFLYSFFSIRSMGVAVTPVWIMMQVLLQFTVVLRNSGTNDALTQKYMSGFYSLLSGAKKGLHKVDHTNDPLLRLQYLARIGWQYDVADVAALIATPFIVTLFVWRDGFFSIDGTSILVRACELGNVWIRFAILLIIKPLFSWIARAWLRVKMRKTLLGKRTMHGTSQLAAKIISERKITAGKSGDAKVQEAFAKVYVEEELAAVKEELSLSGLNYSVLRTRVMRKWKFYLCTVLLTLFSSFPCRRMVLADTTSFDAGGSYATEGIIINSLEVLEPLPLPSVWFYVPHPIMNVINPVLSYDVLNERVAFCTNTTVPYLGWQVPLLAFANGTSLTATG